MFDTLEKCLTNLRISHLGDMLNTFMFFNNAQVGKDMQLLHEQALHMIVLCLCISDLLIFLDFFTFVDPWMAM